MAIWCGMISLLLAVAALVTKHSIKIKDFKNPGFLFCFFWGIIFFLESLDVCGFIEPSNSTYLIIIIGVACFYFGFAFTKLLKVRVKTGETELKYPVVICLALFGAGYETMKMMRSIILLLQGNTIAYVRKIYWTIGGSITTGTVDYIIDNFFIKGISLMLMAVVFVELFRNTLRYKKLLVSLTVYIAIASSIISGGRMIFVDLLVFVVCGFWFGTTTIKFEALKQVIIRKAKQVMFIIVVVAVGGLYLLTVLREGQRYSFLEAFVSNFTLQIPLLSTILPILENSGDLTYGLVSTMGIGQPIAMFFQLLGLIKYPEVYDTLAKYTTEYYYIGGTGMYNCYLTQFFYFYMDFRMFGVVVFDFILGMLCMMIYKKARIACNTKYYAIYSLIVSTLFRSTIRFSFALPGYVIGLLLIYYVYSHKVRLLKK